MSKYEEACKSIEDLNPLIDYLSATREDEWCVDVVRTQGNIQNCFFGHLVNWYYGKDYEGSISPMWDAFEAMWANDFMIYPVNDGKDSRYQQVTPKQRVVAYIKDLWLGIQPDINTLWEEAMKDEVQTAKS